METVHIYNVIIIGLILFILLLEFITRKNHNDKMSQETDTSLNPSTSTSTNASASSSSSQNSVEVGGNTDNGKKYILSIMGIFKNEHFYLKEWLDHHIEQGVDHFYMYSNDPEMEKYTFLSDYMDHVTLIPWTEKTNNGLSTVQRQAYEHCVRTYYSETQYLMMLDIDEFLVSTDLSKDVINVVKSLDTDQTKAIKVQRYNFGSDGHITKPKGRVMDNYTMHEKVCSSYKTIANTDYIDKNKNFFGVHDFPFVARYGKVWNDYFNYAKGYPGGCEQDDINEIPLVINHYYTKSYEEYLNRCKLWKHGGINNFGYRKDCEKKFDKENMNEVRGYEYLDMKMWT